LNGRNRVLDGRLDRIGFMVLNVLDATLKEQAAWWRLPDPGEPELLKATFRRRTFARHAHDRFAIGVIEAGGLAFRYRGQDVLAPAGWVNLAFPGEAHSGRAAASDGWTYRMFYLDPRQMAAVAKSLNPLANEMPFIPAGAVWDPALAKRISSLHRFCEDPDSEPLERQTRLGMLIQDVLRRHSVSQGDRPPRRMRSEVQAARGFIDVNFRDHILLSELAALACMNPYGLVRSFTQELGMPPHAYLVQVRVQRAAALLRQGASSACAAQEAGFSDQSHLNRHFLRNFGITPGAYRKAF
jgi:AraC-like DNA-binding protein